MIASSQKYIKYTIKYPEFGKDTPTDPKLIVMPYAREKSERIKIADFFIQGYF
jgi:hypothetical protein